MCRRLLTRASPPLRSSTLRRVSWVPRCLLRLRDRADARTELDGEGLQLWLNYEFEALLWGVDPDVSCEVLAALVEGSGVELDSYEHREIHAGDFARWGDAEG